MAKKKRDSVRNVDEKKLHGTSGRGTDARRVQHLAFVHRRRTLSPIIQCYLQQFAMFHVRLSLHIKIDHVATSRVVIRRRIYGRYEVVITRTLFIISQHLLLPVNFSKGATKQMRIILIGPSVCHDSLRFLIQDISFETRWCSQLYRMENCCLI